MPALSGDDLLATWRAPDFIKMDVEGAELSALAGCDKILSEVRPVFYIEVADHNSAAATVAAAMAAGARSSGGPSTVMWRLSRFAPRITMRITPLPAA